MSTAPGKDAVVRLHRAGERAALVSEQLGFEERFGKLRKVQRNKTAREAFDETIAGCVEWNESRATNGGSGRPLPCPGFAQQQRRKILKPIPKVTLVPANVVREDAVPKMAAQLVH